MEHQRRSRRAKARLGSATDHTKPQYQQSGDPQRGRASYTSPAKLLGTIRSDDKPRFMLRMAGLPLLPLATAVVINAPLPPRSTS